MGLEKTGLNSEVVLILGGLNSNIYCILYGNGSVFCVHIYSVISLLSAQAFTQIPKNFCLQHLDSSESFNELHRALKYYLTRLFPSVQPACLVKYTSVMHFMLDFNARQFQYVILGLCFFPLLKMNVYKLKGKYSLYMFGPVICNLGYHWIENCWGKQCSSTLLLLSHL